MRCSIGIASSTARSQQRARKRIPTIFSTYAVGATRARFLSSNAGLGDFGLWGFKSRQDILEALTTDRQISQQMSFRYGCVQSYLKETSAGLSAAHERI